MSLTLRQKSLLGAGLVVLILLAPTAYSVLVLRQISDLTAAVAGADARAGLMVSRLTDLFDETRRSARLSRVDPDFISGMERSLEEMQNVIDVLKARSDPRIGAACLPVVGALRAFSRQAVAAPPDDAAFDKADGDVKAALRRLRAAVQRVSAGRTSEAERLARRAATLTLASSAAGLLIAAVLWTGFRRAFSRPLADLETGTERIARGQFNELIPVRADDELGRLAEAFNRMAGALGELERMKADFIAAASHGLRTPLACAKGYLSSLKSGRQGPLPDESRRALNRIEEEVDRVARFVDQLLDLGRLRSGKLPMSMREVPASALFTSIGRSFDALAEERRIQYRIQVAEGVPARITADPDRLGEALINLLGNAFKYTPPGGSVTMSVRGDDGWVRVEVADTGPGIPAEEVPLIFEKYYRGGGVSAEGAGLGLAIARGIVERHGGMIWAESASGAGARFIFRVPVAPRPRKAGRALTAVALAGLLLAGAGCRTRPARSRPASPPRPAPVHVPPPAPAPLPPPPAPGERDLAEAYEALGNGDNGLAVSKLESVVALEDGAPGKTDALLALAQILAAPDSPRRDTARARELLEEVLAVRPPAPRGVQARLLLSLLSLEEDHLKAIAEIQAQIDSMKSEAEALRGALAQREEELRKIKEILLGKGTTP